jgi:hypothetical protein
LSVALSAFFGLSARAQNLPQGLTCGVSYVQDNYPVDLNSCNGVATFSQCSFNIFTGTYDWCANAAPGYVWVSDGDRGHPEKWGYWHQELAAGTTDTTQASNFLLPRGAACGFHHSGNSPGRTCMGFNPSKAFAAIDERMPDGSVSPGQVGCPPGWTPKAAFDMSSDKYYWSWCEYNDELHRSDGQPTIQVTGVACGISDNNQNLLPASMRAGQCMGYQVVAPLAATAACPPGMKASLWRDEGEPENVGLGFCTETSATLPAPKPPPPPPPTCAPPKIDCCGDGHYCLTSCRSVRCQ